MSALAIATAVLALALHGCSYAISPEITRQADRKIPFEQLSGEPAKHAGKTVIYGGTIVQTKNLKKGALIEIVQRELDLWGKPRRTDRTGGRFLVLHPAFLDAMVYAPGRELTVAGEVSGEERGLTGDGAYLLLKSRELKLWPRERLTSDKPQWFDPLYDASTPQGRYEY